MALERLEDLGLTENERRLVSLHGFDFATFLRLKHQLSSGHFPPEQNVCQHTLTAPKASDFVPLAAAGSERAAELEALGNDALRHGKVAVVVLNGGMATRFGGRVKGVVEVVDGKSFIALRLFDVAHLPGVPVFLMNSFATEDETRHHLTANAWWGLDPARVALLTQRISVRLTPKGDVYRDKHGGVGFYAPGHGDVFEVLAGAPAFHRFRDRGGHLVMVSNVDNLGATLAPRVVGAHIDSGKAVTVEVAPRLAGDKGGAPVRVDGHLEVLEGFRFPPTFGLDQIPVFNTNTMWVDVAAIKPDYPFTWFRADKDVDGQAVVQFERLMGEVTTYVDASYLAVPRDGPEGRFLPVKTPQDLIAMQPVVRERFAHR
ncbi:MAG: UTP--glucose-1-phosphate uridylyltransferase [Deltaproteobacteria bacterium]|nr:UTP--glucose-1-phosphate uridylyltransferase [Deltaproteobacteria bacterium]